MSDSVLDRFRESSGLARRIRAAGADHDAAEAGKAGQLDAAEDFGCFGWLRGLHERAIMLELRKRDGNILAIGYSWIERIEYDPSVGITLHAAGRTITLRGRNLNAELRPTVRLFEGLTRHRVPWIQELGDGDWSDAAAVQVIQLE